MDFLCKDIQGKHSNMCIIVKLTRTEMGEVGGHSVMQQNRQLKLVKHVSGAIFFSLAQMNSLQIS
jgi:hypothetical protein